MVMESQSREEFKIDNIDPLRSTTKKPKSLKRSLIAFFKQAWKLGLEDPRKIIHSIKVGFALCLVSLFYLTEPLFNGIGGNAIWAVMTVVVVFEFTAGATLSKGSNRGLGTFLAGCLALLVGYIAEHCGTKGEAIVIGVAIFIFGALTTYFRFHPKIKNKYDYGMLIFLLTFNMIAVSSYRVDNIFSMAYKRLATISIGCGICLLISLIIIPIWAGEDLHYLIINNMESLMKSLEGCITEYFEGSLSSSDESETDETSEDPIYEEYRTILDSKTAEESLANFASWEPRHGKFRFGYPWKQYVKIGVMIRHCAYSVVALHGCLRSEIQTPPSVRGVFRQECKRISREAVKVLEELAESIRHMRRCRSAESMMEHVHQAVKELHVAFRSQPELFVDSRRWHIEEINEVENGITAEESSTTSSSVLLGSAPSVSPLGHMEKAPQFTGSVADDIKHIRKSRFGSDLYSVSMDSTQLNPLRTREDIKSPRPSCSRLVSWHGPESITTNESNRSTCSRNKTNFIEFAEALPLATFASLLEEFTARLEHVAVGVQDLGNLARFKTEGHKQPGLSYAIRSTKSRKEVVRSHTITQNAAE